MDFSEINLNKLKNDELLEIFDAINETIGFLENEINLNEVESK